MDSTRKLVERLSQSIQSIVVIKLGRLHPEPTEETGWVDTMDVGFGHHSGYDRSEVWVDGRFGLSTSLLVMQGPVIALHD